MSTYRVDVGTPPERFEHWTTINVCFHGFADLSTMRDECVDSPNFFRFGHKWKLKLYPGGDEDSEEGYAAVSLVNCSNKSINIQWGCSVRDVNDKEVVYCKKETNEFDANAGSAWYTDNFAKLSTLMKLLVNGALVVEVRIKLPTTGNNAPQYIPTNPINKNMLRLFNEEETADVVFEVGVVEQQTKGKRKRTKASTTTFSAHRIILQKCAPTLYEMCKADGEEGNTTISITDVKPEIFKHMLYNAYGGELSEDELTNDAKDIIDACDKYGLIHLKLEAEASYVNSTTFSMDNMIDNLLYADSKNLALLKEAAMDYIVKNKGDIMGKVSFSNVPGDMITDVLAAMARGEETVGGSTDYNKIRVGTLREKLDDKGLDVDGSREAMIALLKEHND